MRHLQSSSLVPTLHIKAFIRFTTVQDTLVASHFLSNEIQCLDELQAEFLALLILCHGNVFDMADKSEVMNTVPAISFLSELFSHQIAPTIFAPPAMLPFPQFVPGPQ